LIVLAAECGLFSDEARPPKRWLEKRVAAGAIPRVKIGRRVWFDRAAVRAAIVAGLPPTPLH
jgi:hypothetical protein